ncbi:MAG: hypothetical protein LBO73_04530 [Holosporaceae bacterium]|jgi:hypothetical protein|nr:hypothetical protein [Holosporaceae bacterium]
MRSGSGTDFPKRSGVSESKEIITALNLKFSDYEFFATRIFGFSDSAAGFRDIPKGTATFLHIYFMNSKRISGIVSASEIFCVARGGDLPAIGGGKTCDKICFRTGRRRSVNIIVVHGHHCYSANTVVVR